MPERLTELFQRWRHGVGHTPPIPLQDVTAMFFFMADGFLVDQMIDPTFGEELYATMVGVFLRGLEAMASEHEDNSMQEHPR